MSKKINSMDVALEYIYKKYVRINDDECKQTKIIFADILDKVLTAMKAQCNFFKQNCKEVSYSGSLYDKTKVSKLDEIDVDMVINLPISYDDKPNGIHIETADPGYIMLKITNAFDDLDRRSNWEDCNKVTREWRDGDNYFLQDKFRYWLHSVVEKALEALQWKVIVNKVTYVLSYRESGPAYTLNIRKENNNETFLDVDLVPVIQFTRPQWPKNCRCHKDMTTKWMAVPKTNKTIKDPVKRSRFWRLSFKDQEKRFMQNRGHYRITMRLVKKMRDTLKLTAIASYYIKTLFLWKADESDRSYWQQKISIIFRDMVSKLHDAIKDRNIPYYWDKDLDLIKDTKIDNECDANGEYTSKLTKVIQCIDANHINQVMEYLTTRKEFESIQSEDFYTPQWNPIQINIEEASKSPSPLLPIKNDGIELESKVTDWNKARSPNYSLNTDLKFPYSELPYSGFYKLIQIPQVVGELIEHVDYWGQGRIVMPGYVSGFSESYNVNHQYQLVSKGPDAGRKIPNRIPTMSDTDCDTSSYIKDNSVKLVTVLGFIDNTCASDIVRIVNDKVGKVVVFGFNNDLLDKELQSKSIIHCNGCELPKVLRNLTLFGQFKIYLNASDLKTELYNNIVNGEFDAAVARTKTMQVRGNSVLCEETVIKLLEDKVKNVMGYAYKLWHGGSQDIVYNYFPKQFRYFFNGDYVKIINKKHLLSLKLKEEFDRFNERIVLGDGESGDGEDALSTSKLSWTFTPIWEDNIVYFKIRNKKCDMFLNFDVSHDWLGDRKVWGTTNCNEGSLFALEPVIFKNELLFYIFEREYKQGLKLDIRSNRVGDRILWGHNGCVYGHPAYFGWFIMPISGVSICEDAR